MAVLYELRLRNLFFTRRNKNAPSFPGITFYAYGDAPPLLLQDRHETVWLIDLRLIRCPTPSVFDHDGGRMYRPEAVIAQQSRHWSAKGKMLNPGCFC